MRNGVIKEVERTDSWYHGKCVYTFMISSNDQAQVIT